MSQLHLLFQQVNIGQMELRNRIVMAPMGLVYAEDCVNDRLIDFFVERAKGEVGLISASPFCTEPMGRVGRMSLALSEDSYVPSLQRLTERVHEHGAKIAAHVTHGGKYASSAVIGTQSVSASAIFSNWTKEMPRELTIPEIKEIEHNFARAVKRAKEAGFDAVEFNCYSGYLIREFLSPTTNTRTDEYGGSLDNRMRFLLEIIEQVKKEAGSDYPLICKISADEYITGGNTLKETRVLAQELDKAGIHALNVGPGGHDSTIPLTPGLVPRGAFLYIAEAIKEAVGIPVIASYIGDPVFGEQVIREGKADLVAFGRALLADPELPRKAREGRLEHIRGCVRCLQGCYDKVLAGQPVTCLVNASVGREREFEIKLASKQKKVLVIGGGPAGMEAARILALRGHQVSLYEKERMLGGQLNLAAVPPGKDEFRNIIVYLGKQMKELGIEVVLGKVVTPDFVMNENPDVVIIATGAMPIIPEIRGIDRANVVTANQVLAGEVEVGRIVVVVGGGGVGCETALLLAKRGAMDAEIALFLLSSRALDAETVLSLTRKGSQVTIVEMLKSVGRDVGIGRRGVLRKHLRDFGVEIITEAKVDEITDTGVIVTKNGAQQHVDAMTIVLAVGYQPNSELYRNLEGKISELFVIGDSKEPRRALDAIHEGATIARQI